MTSAKKAVSGNLINLEYAEVRDQFKSGDIVLFKGRGLISNLIKKFTKSEYSHSGIVSWWNERLMVLEAVGKGVVVTALSSNVKNYHGDIEWYSCKEELSEIRRNSLVAYAQLELGKDYDTMQLIKIALRRIFKLPIDDYDKLRSRPKQFCSCYVSSAYTAIDIDLKEGASNDFTTPDDIARCGIIEKKGILKIYEED
jgi:hypothetical protein